MTTQAPLRVRLGVDVAALASGLFGVTAVALPFLSRASLLVVVNGVFAASIVLAAVAVSHAARVRGRIDDAIRPALLILCVGTWVSVFAFATSTNAPFTLAMVGVGLALAAAGAYHGWACAQARHYVTRRMFV